MEGEDVSKHVGFLEREGRCKEEMVGMAHA